jgi:hypothetical protein
MTRQTLAEKAVRLLVEGRLRVVLVDAERVEARVCGSEAEHSVGYERGGWWCGCKAHRFGRRCSHLAALQLVTVRPSRERPAASASAARLRVESLMSLSRWPAAMQQASWSHSATVGRTSRRSPSRPAGSLPPCCR